MDEPSVRRCGMDKSSDEQAWVVTIHDSKDDYLDFDLRDILKALGDLVTTYVWVVNLWDWEGPPDTFDMVGLRNQANESEQLCNVVLPNNRLIELAEQITQSVDAEFVGVPCDGEWAGSRSEWFDFENSRARLMITAWDSSFFVVKTKEESHIQALQARFRDIRVENSSA